MATPKPKTPASAPADPAPPARGPVATHLIVRARTNGFRRCGRAWPDTETTVAVDDLAEGDVDRLLAEPELIVHAVAEGDPA